MTFNQMVLRNTLRNRHLYLAYFLSTTFSVMVFFTFTVFAFHPALQEGLNQYVRTGMLTAAIIIYGFAFLFVLYSMDVFIQSRKKEFGVLMIQGMSPKQLKKMVFIENLVIGFFATISGSVLGIGFSQIVLLISKNLIHVKMGFYFPGMPIVVTVISFLILFLLISFFIQLRLPKLTLQELLKAGEMGKGTLKPSVIKSVLAVLMIGTGYAVALLAKGVAVIAVMLPVVAVVIVGTSFFFNQLSVSVVESLKKRQKIFWKKTNMIIFSDLSFRMKDNARSFILVSIISTVAFAAIGTLYGFEQIIVGQFDQIPYEIQLQDAPSAELTAQTKLVNNTLADKKIKAKKAQITTYNGEGEQTLITASDYNQLAAVTGDKKISIDGEAIQLQSKYAQEKNPAVSNVNIGNTVLKVSSEEMTGAVSSFDNYFVVPDDTDFNKLAAEDMLVWNPQNLSYDQLAAFGKTLNKADQTIQGKTFLKQTMTDVYAPVLFVGIFIGIVFFVSAGSFLYFRLYSDMDVDIEKFKMIFKLGMSKKELKKMINEQVGILFFTPIVISFIHGAVALTAMYHVLNRGMALAGWEVLGVFILIQIIYYLVARGFYFRKVYRQVTI